MTIADAILSAFSADEEVTNEQLCERTGYDVFRVCTYMGRLRERGLVARVDGKKPIAHRLAGAARTRAEMLANAAELAPHVSEGSILGSALRTPTSVFELGRFA